ncbi:hypothetical protein OJ996_15270 [Luteolibacter sp. GHJ8]|uniref:Uncharacterized protein n=1 Tax=Luteolibacter rhizosphaerae TaxID=2989719 RepID=A0ABT3G541_9BACT|nr:hypothetical protein [Luteolibacter rhizosphaerae]MCW1914948.1 hypothetical protein [Luteolibacter rhizosphaerae]
MTFRSAAVAVALLLPMGFLLPGCDRARSSSATNASPEVRPPAPGAPASGTSASLPAAVSEGSPHFQHLMGKVDVGGKVLHFEDHQGTREWVVNAVKSVLDGVPEAKALGPLNAEEIVDSIGIADAAASARSLRKDGDSWLARRYSYFPEGRKGFSNLMGKEAFEFRSPSFIPAATDLVVETRIDGTTLPGLIQRIAGACGQQAAASKFLSEPLPIGANLEALLSMTDLHLMLGVDISSWQATPLSPQPVDFFVQITGGKDLLPLLLPMLEQGMGKPKPIAGRQGWEMPVPPLQQPRAVFLYGEDGVLTLASREEYLKYVETAAMKLGQWKEYTAATDHFPAKGNLLVYASPQIPTAIRWVLSKSAKQINEEGAPMIIKAAEMLEAKPWSLCVANEADGISTTSEMPIAADVDMASSLPVLTGTSILFIGARAWKKGSDRAACIMNTRNMQQAVRGYQNIHKLKPGDPIPWEKIHREYVKKPVCTGGRYTFAKTIPKVGSLACECDNKEHHAEPGKTKDW